MHPKNRFEMYTENTGFVALSSAQCISNRKSIYFVSIIHPEVYSVSTDRLATQPSVGICTSKLDNLYYNS